MYLKYFWYVIKHKWFVMIECFKEGLYWRGLIHDLSKLLPSEFFPYSIYFYGSGKNDKDFDFAWLLHQKRNRHHWQWWILPEDEGGIKILPMKKIYLIEMICDWVGAGKAQGHFSPKNDKYYETRKWYKQNGSKMQLDKETRKEIEKRLGVYHDLRRTLR